MFQEFFYFSLYSSEDDGNGQNNFLVVEQAENIFVTHCKT